MTYMHKFRRRPQYLEFFVHLAGSTVSKGHMERVLEWGREAFAWLARRNELLLSPKPSLGQRGPGDHGRPVHSQKPKHSPRASVLGSSSALVPVRHGTGRQRDSQQRLAESMDASRKMAVVVKEPRRGAAVVAKSPAVKKSSRLSSQLSHSLAVAKITRDDLETKACNVLQSLLPEMWINHKCRKRLRIVSSEELPWRSQANLLLATCHLDGLLRKLSGGKWGEGGGGGEGMENAPLVQPHWLRFDTSGVIIDGVIPIHPDALPGQPCKVRAAPEARNGGRWPDTDPPLGSAAAPRPLPLQQAEVCQLLSHLQRAVVLAHRGKNWILLQNACRVLWNAITSLVNASERVDGGQRNEEGGQVVYGLACKPLYFAASGLTELLLHCRANPTLPEPPPTSLKFTPHMDDCNMVDRAFIKRLVFLAIHTLHSNQHWEKMIDIATRFDDVTNHCWSEELVPVITSAQEKLSRRVETHRGKTVAREALEPAAHLDPGPEGHNVYGGVGYALALVSVPLDVQATQQRLEGRGGGAERSLAHCRQLLARYLAGSNRDIAEPPSLAPSPHASPTVDLPPLPTSHLPTVIAAYDAAIVSLIDSKQRDLAVMAMHELGSLMYHSHNSKSAGRWWAESLSTLLQTKDPLNSWRMLAAEGSRGERRRGGGGGRGVPEGRAVHPLLEICGVWGCLLGGIMAMKLAEYIYRNELDIRLEYTLLAAALFKSVLFFSLPHPTSDLDYATYPHQFPSSAESGQQFLPGMELFSDPYRCDLPSLLSSLHHCSQDLVTRHHAVKALPVLWLYQHLAHSVCRNVWHTVMAKILKLQAMCELCLFSECLALLAEIQSGARLPQSSSEHSRPPDTHVGSIQFNNSLPLNDPTNLKALNAVVERPLSPGLASLYCESVMSWLMLTQAKLFTAMAATCTAVPRPSLLRTVSDQRPSTMAAPPTQTSAPSSTTSVHSGSSMHSSRRSQRKFSLATDDIKLSLLNHTERLLVTLCHQLESSSRRESVELRVWAHLQLAQASLTLHHGLTAVQLSLAAMRLLQREGGGGKSPSSESSPDGGRSCDVRLWLECRVMLARSLMGRGDAGGGGVVDCGGQCEEGVGECEACGEVEMTAELHYTAAMHALTCEPCDLAKISSHAQSALQLLESLPELSPHARLLRCRASILLADVSCMLGGATWGEMAQVFQGLMVMLEKQLGSESLCLSIYQPHRVLLASVQLRLAHLHTLLATSTLNPAERMEHAIAARRACEEGRETLRESMSGDPCLAAELAFHYGWLQNSNLVPGLATPGTESMCAEDTSLLHATRTIADCAADYRLAFTCYCELAQSFAEYSKQPFKPPLSDTPQKTAVPPGSSSSGERPKASQSSSRARSKLSQQELETEKMSKAEREWVKERGREAYCAWALTKTALQTQTAIHNLQLLTSELHNEGATTPIPDKVLTDLPDFALLDLCQSGDLLNVLATSLEEVPIEALAPSAQLANPAGVSWFRVAVYASHLLQQCFWQKSAISSDTDWALHYHSQTASVYAKFNAVVTFLTRHFTQFARNSSLPPPPSLLSSFTSCRPPATSTPGGQSVALPVVSGAAAAGSEPHLTAGDTEVMVVWHRPFPTSSTHQSPSSDVLHGLFALNFKAIKTHPPANIVACGAEVYCVKTSLSALSALHDSWEELAVASKTYLDTKATSRPVSRSPSKQKKSERPVKTPPELQSKLVQAVQMLCTTFNLQKKEDQLPKIEPHTVASVTRALHPLTHTTIKGDVYYFFMSVFKQ